MTSVASEIVPPFHRSLAAPVRTHDYLASSEFPKMAQKFLR
jgi:hypothetical protein